MTASAIVMAIAGLGMSFISHELLAFIGAGTAAPTVVLVQVTGALYLGFAILNWSARGVLIGGIYSRPVTLGNLLHFTVAAIVLIKLMFTISSSPLAILTVIYSVFAIWFGLVLFHFPGSAKH